jgi:prepilin peptidase CpaA
MSNQQFIISEAALIPLIYLIYHYDTRYRRIPNAFVLGALISGLSANTICFGWAGLGNSLAGGCLAFGLMFSVRLSTGLGAGDVKLFGAIGAIIGLRQVASTFLLVILLGGVLAAIEAVRAGKVRQTMFGVYQIFIGLLPGGQLPLRARFAQSSVTLPYGVAITCGSAISVLIALARG